MKIKITAKTESDCKTILKFLTQAEENGEIENPFNVHRKENVMSITAECKEDYDIMLFTVNLLSERGHVKEVEVHEEV